MAGGRKSQRIAAASEHASKRSEESTPIPPTAPQERPAADLRSLLPKTPGTKRRVIISAEESSTQGEKEILAESVSAPSPQEEVKSGDTEVLEEEEVNPADVATTSAVVPVSSPTVVPEQPQSSIKHTSASSGDEELSSWEMESSPESDQEKDQYTIAVRKVTQSIEKVFGESSKDKSSEPAPVQPIGSPGVSAAGGATSAQSKRKEAMSDPEDIIPLSEIARKKDVMELSSEESPEESPLIRRSKRKTTEPIIGPAKRTRLARSLDTELRTEQIKKVGPASSKKKAPRPRFDDSHSKALAQAIALSKGKQVLVEGVEYDSIWFTNEECVKKYKQRKEWIVVPERVLKIKTWPVPEVLNLLEEANLISTLTSVRPSAHQIVKEVAWNLTPAFGDPTSEDYGIVYVRGAKIFISAEEINHHFGLTDVPDEGDLPDLDHIASVLTGGKVQSWEEGTSLKASLTTSLHAILFMICTSNWIPVHLKQLITPAMGRLIYAISQKFPVNIGEVIFNNLVSLIDSKNVKQSIGNPSLIYDMVMAQVPHIKQSTDRLSGELKKFSIDHKLFGGEHLLDIERPSAFKAKVKTEGAPTAQLTPLPFPSIPGVPPSSAYGKLSRTLKARVVDHLEAHLAHLNEEKKKTIDLLKELRYSEESEEEGAESD